MLTDDERAHLRHLLRRNELSVRDVLMLGLAQLMAATASTEVAQ